MIMKRSPFVSEININNDVVALFHSLDMQVIYIDKNKYKNIDLFLSESADELNLRNFVADDDFDETSYLEALVKELDTNNFEFTTLKMFVTTACNLDCKYCLIEKNLQTRNCPSINLDFEKAKQILTYFSNATLKSPKQNRTLMLYGGEPLINEINLKKIISEAREMENDGLFNGDLEIVLESNGMLITQEIAEFLRENRIFVIVSIDGTKASHDSYRIDKNGNGSWEKAVNGYKILKDAGCLVVISTVFTNEFAKDYKKNLDFLLENLNPYSIGLNLYHVLDGQEIEDDQTVDLIDQYIESWKYASERGLYIEHIMRRIRPLVEKKIRLKDCGACGKRMVSDCNGNIGICEGLVGDDTYFFKRNPKESLSEDQVFIEWSKRTQLRMAECIGCCAQGICGGGCVYNGLIMNGNANTPDPYICEASKKLVQWAVRCWYEKSDANKRIHDAGYALLRDNERNVILGNTPIHPAIPLQSISKEREYIKG